MNDLISRSALIDEVESKLLVGTSVIKLINKQPTVKTHLSECEGDCKSCWKTKLVNAATVEVKPKGEWERIPYSYVGGYRCSCCGQRVLENNWNFCPECGADMRKKVE